MQEPSGAVASRGFFASRFPLSYGDLGFAVRPSPPDDDPPDEPEREPPELPPSDVLPRGDPLLPPPDGRV